MTSLLHTNSSDSVSDHFRSLAPSLYEGDPVWAPASEEAIDDRLACAATGEIRLRATVAIEGRRPVARAMAIRPADFHQQRDGWVGLFECHPDSREAGAAVLDSCAAWLGREGASEVVGPRIDELRAGLLIEGRDRPHTVFTAHNPLFYLDVFRDAGFAIRTTMVGFEFTRDRVPTFRRLPRGRVVVRSPDPSRLDADLERIEAFQNSTFGTGLGRVSRSARASQRMAQQLLPILDLDLVIMAEDRDGTTIGVLICVPDVWQAPPIDRARLVSVGVAPGWRGLRVSMAMGATLVPRLLAKGYRSLEGSWILADNTRPQILARALGGTPGRTFALLSRTP